MESTHEHTAIGKGRRRARSPFFRVGLLALALACLTLFAVSPAFAHAEGAAPSETPASLLYTVDDVEFASETSALIEGVPFGVVDFERIAKGTQREADGAPEGYRFPVSEDANVVVLRTPDGLLAYVRDFSDAGGGESSGEPGASGWDPDDEVAISAMLFALDEEARMGGEPMSRVAASLVPTGQRVVEAGAFRYDFEARGAARERYVTVALAGAPQGSAGAAAAEAAGIDLGDGAAWCVSARIVPAGDIELPAPPSPIGELLGFLSTIDYRPLWVSVKTAGIALVFSFALGLLAAWRVMGTSSRMKGLLDSVLTIPMVLPPTVCGFLLLMLFGHSTSVGRWLVDHGIDVVFTWQAAVISAVVVSFPLVYRTALGAFESLDPSMLDAARTLGWSEPRVFCKLMMPLAWPSIAAGTVLAFARAMGEFGCTLFFAGNYAGVTQTIPIAIYFEWMGGNTQVALFWVVVVIVFSFAVIAGINAYAARHGATAVARRGVRAAARDGLEETGGDALRIDARALARLLGDDDA